MHIIEWTDDLSVGIKSIDDEHKELIRLINKLGEAMDKGHGNQVIHSILDELVEYTMTHFAHEEEYLKKYNYPDFDKHQIEHELLYNKVSDLNEDLDDGDPNVVFAVFDFLDTWIKTHIQKVDKMYSKFLIEKGVV